MLSVVGTGGERCFLTTTFEPGVLAAVEARFGEALMVALGFGLIGSLVERFDRDDLLVTADEVVAVEAVE